MRELRPIPINVHLRRLKEEIAEGCCYDLKSKSYWQPHPEVDLKVQFHGLNAATPVGPAAGPHSQMAQNILLSYMVGVGFSN